MTELSNLSELRNLPIISEIVYVKGYDNAGDGGGGIFLWRTESAFQSGYYGTENYGTIVKSNLVPETTGSWIRQYEGFVNVLYFGCFGVGNDYTDQLERAIDFATENNKNNSVLKGSTVFIPNGSYPISRIILKSGITITGESIERTAIYSPDGLQDEYLFEIENGPVFINISNLRLIGNRTEKGCFHFQATNSHEPPFHGGLWYSKLTNIEILQFN